MRPGLCLLAKTCSTALFVGEPLLKCSGNFQLDCGRNKIADITASHGMVRALG